MNAARSHEDLSVAGRSWARKSGGVRGTGSSELDDYGGRKRAALVEIRNLVTGEFEQKVL